MRKFIVIFLSFLFLNAGVSSAVFAEEVMYNTETQKVHKVTCAHAKKCTKNCIKIDRKDAYNKGGKPCNVCGGW